VKTGRHLLYLALETPREGEAAHTHVHEIVKGLRSLGWDVSLLVAHRGGASSEASYFTRLYEYIRVQWALIRKFHEADAIFMRAHFAALPVSLAAWAAGLPVFQEINGQPDDIFVTYPWLGRLGALIRWSYRVQTRMAAHVFVVTEGLHRWAVNESRHTRISIVTNAANIDLFTPEGPRPSESSYIVFCGSLTAWHGIGTMIRATHRPIWPDGVKLIIIGDGVERKQLENLEPSESIVWLGRLPQAEVATYLRGSMAALSITEDTADHLTTGVAPLKLFEAMASGVPVIVTDLPFQRELVQNYNTGWIIPMANPDALAETVAELVSNRDLSQYRGQNGAAYVRQHGSWASRAEAIHAAISPIVDHWPGHSESHV
jgi:glycosyltransferase involved in cell wall biosynthesis